MASQEEVVCAAEPLQAFVEMLVRRMGADADVAAEVARHLVRANLSGHDSHGVLRIPQYVEEADRGVLVPAARPVVAEERELAAVVDGCRSFGHVSTMLATRWTLERAKRHGVAMAVVRRSTHIGRLGEYTEAVAEAGLIGIVTVGLAGRGLGGMVPFGGRERFLGTNPWSIAVPGRRGRLLFDAATSTVAEGKVRVARAKGVPLPPECVQDGEGHPTRAPDALYAGGALLPLGGRVAGHKGYGLALASALFGALGMEDDAGSGSGGSLAGGAAPGRAEGVFVQVIDPAAFGSADRYRERVDATLAAARAIPPGEGRSAVLVPGDPEDRTREERDRDGLRLPAATWADLARAAGRYGVPLPEARPGR